MTVRVAYIVARLRCLGDRASAIVSSVRCVSCLQRRLGLVSTISSCSAFLISRFESDVIRHGFFVIVQQIFLALL